MEFNKKIDLLNIYYFCFINYKIKIIISLKMEDNANQLLELLGDMFVINNKIDLSNVQTQNLHTDISQDLELLGRMFVINNNMSLPAQKQGDIPEIKNEESDDEMPDLEESVNITQSIEESDDEMPGLEDPDDKIPGLEESDEEMPGLEESDDEMPGLEDI